MFYVQMIPYSVLETKTVDLLFVVNDISFVSLSLSVAMCLDKQYHMVVTKA
jgi:hypothetical protein